MSILLTLYSCTFAVSSYIIYLHHHMLVNMKLDVSGFKRIAFLGCKFHWSSLFRIVQQKQSFQYWHSRIVESLWKTLVNVYIICHIHHLLFLYCHLLYEQISPSALQMYFTEQCKHHARPSVRKLAYFNADMNYINPASFAIPWNIPFLSSNSVEGASNSATLP